MSDVADGACSMVCCFPQYHHDLKIAISECWQMSEVVIFLCEEFESCEFHWCKFFGSSSVHDALILLHSIAPSAPCTACSAALLLYFIHQTVDSSLSIYHCIVFPSSVGVATQVRSS